MKTIIAAMFGFIISLTSTFSFSEEPEYIPELKTIEILSAEKKPISFSIDVKSIKQSGDFSMFFIIVSDEIEMLFDLVQVNCRKIEARSVLIIHVDKVKNEITKRTLDEAVESLVREKYNPLASSEATRFMLDTVCKQYI